MATLRSLEDSIFQTDGIRVSLDGDAPALPDYWKVAFKATGRVSEFVERFGKRYPGIDITVFDGVGRPAHGNYLLRNLRATYGFAWVQNEYGSMTESFVEFVLDQKRRIKALKKALRKSEKPARVKEDKPDPYAVLNVGPDASDADIALAFKRRMQVFHPDKFPGMHELVVELVTDKLQQITAARDDIVRLRSTAV